MKQFLLACTLILVIGHPAHAASESLQTVMSRGVELPFVLTEPDSAPIASVILLPGGHGKLNLGSSSGAVRFGWGENNNLVRTRTLYADKGFLVATLDAPSNRKKMNAIWRMSGDHAEDIKVIVDFLREKTGGPVWVIGTSMGTFSAANAGVRLNKDIAGIVLTSSITRSRKKWKIYGEYPNGIIDMDLAQVERPVLVVSHQNDECVITPAGDIDKLAGRFRSSAKVETAIFTGGSAPQSDACKALSAHGFYGIEQDVVDRISTFINAN